MKKSLIRLISAVLTVCMLIQTAGISLGTAADAVGRAINPAGQIELIVPDTLRDGNNYFFIREADFAVSEKSDEKIYIPIQRSGDLSCEADVTLKVMDITARHDINYRIEVYREEIQPEIIFGDVSIIDLALNAEAQDEVELLSEDEMGALIYENGGADIVDSEGNTVGSVSAYPLDENGNPVHEGSASDEVQPAESEWTEPEDEALTGPAALRAARNAYTGSVSDRQELQSEAEKQTAVNFEAEDEAPLAEDSFPGKEYYLHYDEGEEAKFIVITPLYSDAADGDATIMLMLKDAPADYVIPDDFNNRAVLIIDEDEPETVFVELADAEITAENGEAVITVNRQGSINNVVGVHVESWGGSARMGEDYGGVGADLYFPMGITSRSLELAVGTGYEEKDFYVTISPIGNVTTGLSTSHVIIPAAEPDSVLLMADDSMLGEEWNLKDRKYSASGSLKYKSDISIKLETEEDKEQKQWITLDTDRGYAWDGVSMNFRMHTWYADEKVAVTDNAGTNLYLKDFGDDTKDNQIADAYYGTIKAPDNICIVDWCYDTHWSLFRDCMTDLTVYSVKPIKRTFRIVLEDAQALKFEGMTSNEVLSQYESVLLDGKLDRSVSLNTGDSFAVSRVGSIEYARLSAVEAIGGDSEPVTIASNDGISSTVTVELSPETIDKLAAKGLIKWEKDGSSYSGTITVRPVFSYVKDVVVEINDDYGNLMLNGRSLTSGRYDFSYGDKLVFTENSETMVGMKAVGIAYESRLEGKNGPLTGKGDCEYFLKASAPGMDDKPCFILTSDYYTFSQVYSEIGNTVEVRIPTDDVQYFDKSFGFLSECDCKNIGGYVYYTVRSDVLTNELIELAALPADGSYVPVWTIGDDETVYSGKSFVFYAGESAKKNLVTLRMDTDAGNHASYLLSGSVYTSTLNLKTMHEADDMLPAVDAVIMACNSGTITDENGRFVLPVQNYVGGSTVRYLISYNGEASIRDVKLPAASQEDTIIPVSLEGLHIDSRAHSGAHFADVTAELTDYNTIVTDAVEMNGGLLRIAVKVAAGNEYSASDGMGGTTVKKENVTDVTLYFKSSLTGEVHGEYSISDGSLKWDEETSTAVLVISRFTPESPDLYTYGDVLMAQLTTDREVGANSWFGTGMEYQPVSTGFTVISRKDYVPQTFEFGIDNVAEALGIEGVETDDEGKLMETKYSFGAFPYLGEVTAAARILTSLTNKGLGKVTSAILKDLHNEAENAGNIGGGGGGGLIEGGDHIDGNSEVDDDEYAYDPVADEDLSGRTGEGTKSKWQFAVAFQVEQLSYGGIRCMIAVIGAYQDGNVYSTQKKPYDSAGAAWDFFTSTKWSSIFGSSHKTLIHNRGQTKTQELTGVFGGPHFSIGLYVGIYLDYGYVEIRDTNADGETKVSGDLVFMGAGGFFGGKGDIGYTFYTFIICVPVYINAEASLDVRFYLGAEADPSKSVDYFYNTNKLKGQDYGFTFEFRGTVSAGLTFGAGIYKVIGVRATGGISFEAGYGSRMAEWYPNIGTDWGGTLDATFTGSIDVIVTSIDLLSFSWPTGVSFGWMEYFQIVRRANKLNGYIDEGIEEGRGSDTGRQEVREKENELIEILENKTGDTEQLKKKIDALKDLAYEKGIITWSESYAVYLDKVVGVLGKLLEDESESSSYFRTRNHVNSDWVAGKYPLKSGFGPVVTETLEKDALAQTSSRIISIGGNRFLMVYLDDDTTRDRQMAEVLKYTVYDANDDTWTYPQTIQKDSTADGKPHLADAGDRIIVSWASIEESKYEALKSEVAAELYETDGVEPSAAQIQDALEMTPSRVMAAMDIFTAEFDKASMSFNGEPEQLTDDEFYDDYPQAVYDSETGDIIVLYYKTASDDEAYTDENEKLLDLVRVSPDPEKTYSVICYMLYNNQTDTADTFGETHEPGWAKDYLFENETSQSIDDQKDYLAAWGGQRFLASVIRGENGEMSDPPIADLTAAPGYNGLAAYAFTVDKDFNLDTAEDRELYIQFYDFSDHSTYVPVRIAGDRTEDGITRQVDVGNPQIIRNDGSTWLFWREDGSSLRYLNVSALLNARIKNSDTGEDAKDEEYALRPNGTLAEGYEPDVMTVDFGSMMTDDAMNITDYNVISDADGNLYVVWTDAVSYVREDDGVYCNATALEVFASAKIKEEKTDDENSAPSAVWSKPFRLTRENKMNDGVALALADNGDLIIVHNCYEKLLCDSEDRLIELINEGRVGIVEKDGKNYILGSLYYDSPNRLKVTHCKPIGSLEVTSFKFSHSHPVAGETVKVEAVIENIGLTAAHGCQVDFYECKNGVRIKKLYSVDSSEIIPVNTAVKVSFPWTVPAEGADGYSVEAEISEKKKDDSTYESVSSYSDTFVPESAFITNIEKCEQNGDVFDVEFTVTNCGNKDAEDGTTATLNLAALYGDISERYGMDSDILITEDISGLKPRETRTVRKSITLPVSVFRFCGYDAVQVFVWDADGIELNETGQRIITLDAPLNLMLNGGDDMSLKVNEAGEAELTYDSTVFMDVSGKTIYSVSDPSVASVDENGKITALGKGTTMLTATILPSGRSTEIEITVDGEADSSIDMISRYIRDKIISMSGNKTEAENVTKSGISFVDVAEGTWYSDAVQWAVEKGITNGTDALHFSPDNPCTRAQMVTFLWRAAGEPEPKGTYMPFADVESGAYYEKAVLWAVESGITNGIDNTHFAPDMTVTRAQTVTFLYRFAGAKTEAAEVFADVPVDAWYAEAVTWAAENGITLGTSDTTFSPDLNCVRAQIVTFLYRLMG